MAALLLYVTQFYASVSSLRLINYSLGYPFLADLQGLWTTRSCREVSASSFETLVVVVACLYEALVAVVAALVAVVVVSECSFETLVVVVTVSARSCAALVVAALVAAVVADHHTLIQMCESLLQLLLLCSEAGRSGVAWLVAYYRLFWA